MMIRNIDILYTMQDRVRKFKFYVEELSIVTDVEETEISTLVKNGDDLMIGLLNSINDVDKFLDSLTEDIKDTMLSAGFDSDDFKVWNAALILNPLNIEGLLETFEGAMDTLELYLIETIKGYRILTQLAYDMNPRLPGLNKQAEKN
ncbi:MAG: hypothetical protein IJ278_06535 [Clostridia bacterium]|nr:hypothetical protein [Tyzzerella sp.]MBQ7951361.1 hypothetical protein [Clostridia bacterium]MBQ8765435.1 hypothetical protein [Clostridia bacterium]